MQLKSVECITLEKRNKQQVYILNVTTSNNEYEIFRTYTTFFDFRTQLVENSKQLNNITVPELLDLKWFQKALGKTSEKRKRQINEFCKGVLELPVELSECEHVRKFFEKWPSDETEAQTDQSAKQKKNEKKRKSVEKSLSAEKHLSKDLMKEIQDVQKTRKVSSSTEPANGLSEPGHRRSVDDSRPILKKTLSLNDSIDSLDQYVAIQEVTKIQDSDLNIADGDIVHVLEKNLSGWWFVMKEGTGEQGWAPGGVLQPLDPDKHEEDSDTEQVQEDQCPVYEAISDYTAKGHDEVTYRKSEKLHVLQMRTDGWWKIRNSNGTTGITPAVNLARISDGSGPIDPLYSDITMYSQQSVYKKKTPPKRNSSRFSLSELYAKVEKKPAKPENCKPSPISEHPPSSPSYLSSTMNAEKNKPQVPPKKPGLLKQENYVEIEFNEDENAKRKSKGAKFVIVSDGVEYSEINPGSLPEKLPKPPDDPNSHMYLNITRKSQQPSYENVDEVKPKSIVGQFFEVTQDYNPTMTHREGLPAVKGDIIKVTKDERQHVMCVMCLKERIETKPCEGWIPKKLLRHVNVEVIDRDSHDIPVVQVLATSPIEASNDLYADALKSPNRPERSRAFWGKKKVKKGEWFAGQMSRDECEVLLKDAKDLEFVIRESKSGNEDFSISVKYRDTVKHFKVENVGEGKYQIGGFMFKNLSAIVKHYTKQPLFHGENGKSTSLGKPYNLKGKV